MVICQKHLRAMEASKQFCHYLISTTTKEVGFCTALAYLPIGCGAHLDVTDNSLRQAGLAQSEK
jgi:hypothetical protein